MTPGEVGRRETIKNSRDPGCHGHRFGNLRVRLAGAGQLVGAGPDQFPLPGEHRLEDWSLIRSGWLPLGPIFLKQGACSPPEGEGNRAGVWIDCGFATLVQ
jgi:hypothetical protein